MKSDVSPGAITVAIGHILVELSDFDLYVIPEMPAIRQRDIKHTSFQARWPLHLTTSSADHIDRDDIIGLHLQGKNANPGRDLPGNLADRQRCIRIRM